MYPAKCICSVWSISGSGRKQKHLYNLLTTSAWLPLFGVLVLTLYKSSECFPPLWFPYILSTGHEETFLIEFWFTFTSLLSQDPFLVRSAPFTSHIWLLCLSYPLTSLAVLPAPPWLRSCCPFSELSFMFLLALSLVRPLPCCTPACFRVSATISMLLACSPLFISFHLAFHCFPCDIPVCVAYLWYEPSPYSPSQTLFLNLHTVFVCPIPFGHVLRSSSSVSASCSSHASRLCAQSSATNFQGNLI